MKKVNFKHIFLMLSFMLSFLFIGLENVKAQAPVGDINLNGTLYSPAQGSFVSKVQAKLILEAESQAIKTQLENGIFLPGTQAYKLAEGRISYYSNIIMLTDTYNGPVSRAIGGGLNLTSQELPDLTSNDLLQLRQTAINLLKS